MRVVVFAVGVVAVLSGISAYADQMSVPAVPVAGVVSLVSTTTQEKLGVAEAPSVQLMDLQTNPAPSVPAKPTAVTAEPSSVVLMATGFLGIGGMMWKRRSLTH